MDVQIRQDNTEIVLNGIKDAIEKSLETSGILVSNAAKKECPVDTGRLRNSITHQKSGDKSVDIGTNEKYGKFVELGTSKMRAQAFLRPAAENCQAKIATIFKNNLK